MSNQNHILLQNVRDSTIAVQKDLNMNGLHGTLLKEKNKKSLNGGTSKLNAYAKYCRPCKQR